MARGHPLTPTPLRIFSKQARSTEDLVEHLARRGLEIADREPVRVALDAVGYYRLLSYMRPFQRFDPRSGVRRFTPGTTIDKILDLYTFDRELRLLCLDGIERVEIAIRATIVHELSTQYGPHFYYDNHHYRHHGSRGRFLSLVKTISNPAIDLYRRTYSSPLNPPIWMLMEGVTFGQLSHFFASLHITRRKIIAKRFFLAEPVFTSWLKTITTLRNTCAHHHRLWNATIKGNEPKHARNISSQLRRSHTFYARATVLGSLLNAIDRRAKQRWRNRLRSLLAKYPSVPMEEMGFFTGWQDESPWIDNE